MLKPGTSGMHAFIQACHCHCQVLPPIATAIKWMNHCMVYRQWHPTGQRGRVDKTHVGDVEVGFCGELI